MGFADVVNTVSPTQAYVFGQLATAPAGGIAIQNQAELALHFNAFEDFAGKTSINSEIERYQDFNPINHAFASDRLDLVGALPSGMAWNGVVSAPTNVDLAGNPNPIANLGLTSTTGLRVGQLAAIEYKGLYCISALVANTSISLQQLGGSPTTSQSNQLIVWLPIDSALLTAQASSGQSVLSFASLPAGATVGAAVSIVTSSEVSTRNADHRVVSASGTSVSVSPSLLEGTLAVGTRVLFMPPVTSGQIWSRDQFSLTDASAFLAVEFDVVLMGGSSAYRVGGINTASAYAAAPADVPWGAWPALWLYSADDRLGDIKDASEIDVMEMYWSATCGPTLYTGYNHGPGVGAAVYDKLDAGWTGNSSYNYSPAPLAGAHKLQLVYSNGMTWRYIDGVLIKAANFRWTSAAPAQIGMNLAIGSLAPGLAANLQVPIQSSNFAGQTLGIKRLRIWKA